MPPEILLQILEIVLILAGGLVFWARTQNRKTDAVTATVAADAKQADAVTALALMNNQERIAAQLERQNLQEQLSKLRESFSYEQGVATASLTLMQGRLDRLQVKADASEAQVRSLETQMSELTHARTADQTIIAELKSEVVSLKTEIVSLNKTIVTLTEENSDLKKRTNELYERVIGKQAAAIPQAGSPVTSQGAIPIELTVSGGITAMSPEKPPPVDSKP